MHYIVYSYPQKLFFVTQICGWLRATVRLRGVLSCSFETECFMTEYFVCCLQPERFVNLGIDPPKGVLLFGPPGTGKTLCARAVANRTDACFIRVIGSELVQKYVGEVSMHFH